MGNSFSLADAAVYVALLNNQEIFGFPEICRWFDHVQHLCSATSGLPIILMPKPGVAVFPLLKGPSCATPPAALSSSSASAASSSCPSVEVTSGATSASGETDPKLTKEKKGGDKPPKAEKKTKESPASSETTPAAQSADDNPTLLDICVGRVVKCWDHAESDKLLCEEIDIGEASGPRSIASGLRAFYQGKIQHNALVRKGGAIRAAISNIYPHNVNVLPDPRSLMVHPMEETCTFTSFFLFLPSN